MFVVLAHDRRRILHVNVTPHPTSAWTRQQLREAFPRDPNAQFVLHDRDTTFDPAFGRAVEALGLTAVRTAPRSPWQNPYVERVIGSIRRECLDHIIVFNQRHLRRVLRAYVAYYQQYRTHLALGKDAPAARAVQRTGRIVVRPELGGLHHRYERHAAQSSLVVPGLQPQLDVEVCPRARSESICKKSFDSLRCPRRDSGGRTNSPSASDYAGRPAQHTVTRLWRSTAEELRAIERENALR